MAGVFITIEGVEGSGKSTQLARLSARIQRLGLPLVVSKEPGGTSLGKELRRLLLEPHPSGETWCPDAELLLFYADRAQHLHAVVRPALAEGKLVLLDRFEDSTRAYQGASGVPDGAMDRIGDLVLRRLKPHLTLLLDLDPEEGMVRVAARNGAQGAFAETRFDQAALEFHRRVRARFLALAQAEPNRIAVVSARESPDLVEAALWARVSPLLRSAGLGVD